MLGELFARYLVRILSSMSCETRNPQLSNMVTLVVYFRLYLLSCSFSATLSRTNTRVPPSYRYCSHRDRVMATPLVYSHRRVTWTLDCIAASTSGEAELTKLGMDCSSARSWCVRTAVDSRGVQMVAFLIEQSKGSTPYSWTGHRLLCLKRP